MNVYFDTEFTGLQKDTTLISIGCIDENERTFYAELTDYDKKQVNDWIQENVIDNLILGKKPDIKIENNNYEIVGNKKAVAKALKEWLEDYDEVQLISDVCHYDMVLFIDLFGSAFDIPENVNAACHDINQDIAKHLEISEKEAFDYTREDLVDEEITGDKHNSLYDAKVIKSIYAKVIDGE